MTVLRLNKYIKYLHVFQALSDHVLQKRLQTDGVFVLKNKYFFMTAVFSSFKGSVEGR